MPKRKRSTRKRHQTYDDGDGEFLLSARRVGPVFLFSEHAYFPKAYKPHAGLEEQSALGRYVAALVPVRHPASKMQGSTFSSTYHGAKADEIVSMKAQSPKQYALRLVGCGCLCALCRGQGGCGSVDSRCRLVGASSAVGSTAPGSLGINRCEPENNLQSDRNTGTEAARHSVSGLSKGSRDSRSRTRRERDRARRRRASLAAAAGSASGGAAAAAAAALQSENYTGASAVVSVPAVPAVGPAGNATGRSRSPDAPGDDLVAAMFGGDGAEPVEFTTHDNPSDVRGDDAFPASYGLTSPGLLQMEEGRRRGRGSGGTGGRGPVRSQWRDESSRIVQDSQYPSASTQSGGGSAMVLVRGRSSSQGVASSAAGPASASSMPGVVEVEEDLLVQAERAIASLPGSVATGVTATGGGVGSPGPGMRGKDGSRHGMSHRPGALSLGSPYGDVAGPSSKTHTPRFSISGSVRTLGSPHGISHGAGVAARDPIVGTSYDKAEWSARGSLAGLPPATGMTGARPTVDSRRGSKESGGLVGVYRNGAVDRLRPAGYSSLELEPGDGHGRDIEAALAAGARGSREPSESGAAPPPRLVPAALASDLRTLLRREVLRVEVRAALDRDVTRRAALRALRHRAVRGRPDRQRAVALAAKEALLPHELYALGLGGGSADPVDAKTDREGTRRSQSAWASEDRAVSTPTGRRGGHLGPWREDSHTRSSAMVVSEAERTPVASARLKQRWKAQQEDEAGPSMRTLALAVPLPSAVTSHSKHTPAGDDERWASATGGRSVAALDRRWLLVPVWCPVHHAFRSCEEHREQHVLDPLDGASAEYRSLAPGNRRRATSALSGRASMDSAGIAGESAHDEPEGSMHSVHDQGGMLEAAPALPWLTRMASLGRLDLSEDQSRKSSHADDDAPADPVALAHWTASVSAAMGEQVGRGVLGMPAPPGQAAMRTLLDMLRPPGDSPGSAARGRSATVTDQLVLLSKSSKGSKDSPVDEKAGSGRRRSRLLSSASYGSTSTGSRESRAGHGEAGAHDIRSAGHDPLSQPGSAQTLSSTTRRPFTASGRSNSVERRTLRASGSSSRLAQVEPAPLTADDTPASASGGGDQTTSGSDERLWEPPVSRAGRPVTAPSTRGPRVRQDTGGSAGQAARLDPATDRHKLALQHAGDDPVQSIAVRKGRSSGGSRLQPVVGLRMQLPASPVESAASSPAEPSVGSVDGAAMVRLEGRPVTTAMAVHDARAKQRRRRRGSTASASRPLSGSTGRPKGLGLGRMQGTPTDSQSWMSFTEDGRSSVAGRSSAVGSKGARAPIRSGGDLRCLDPYAARAEEVPFAMPAQAAGVLVARSRLPAFVLRPGNKGGGLEALLGVQFEGGRDRISKGSSKNFVMEAPLAALVQAGVRLALPEGKEAPALRGVPPSLLAMPRAPATERSSEDEATGSPSDRHQQQQRQAGAGAEAAAVRRATASSAQVPLLQFGRSGQRRFAVDFLYPLVSPAQALGALLSCFSHAVVERAEAEGVLEPAAADGGDDRGLWHAAGVAR